MAAPNSPELARDMRKLRCSSTKGFRHIHPYFRPDDNSRPKGRSGHCMCTDESDFYVFGGYSPRDDRNGITSSCVLPELWKFNFATQKWLKISAANTPETCASSCLAVQNKQLFVFGGTGYPFGHIMSNTIKTVQLDRQQRAKLAAAGETTPPAKGSNSKLGWYLLDTSPYSYNCLDSEEDTMPPRAYGQSLIFHRGDLYVFGGAIGYYSEAVADLHKLSLETRAWDKLTSTGTVPTGRYKQEVVKYGDSFFVLGGGRLNNAESLERLHVYDSRRNHWAIVSTTADEINGYPKSRCSFGCVRSGQYAYISGGRHYTEEIEHESLSDIWSLNLETLHWMKLKVSLPVPLYFHGAVVAPSGHMYIFGGVHLDGYRSPHLYKIRLPFAVPKLSELVWEVVSESLSNASEVKHNDLVALGIPWNFLDRVCFQSAGSAKCD